MNFNEKPKPAKQPDITWLQFILQGFVLVAAIFFLYCFMGRILNNAIEHQRKADRTEQVSKQADSDKLE